MSEPERADMEYLVDAATAAQLFTESYTVHDIKSAIYEGRPFRPISLKLQLLASRCAVEASIAGDCNCLPCLIEEVEDSIYDAHRLDIISEDDVMEYTDQICSIPERGDGCVSDKLSKEIEDNEDG